MKEYKRYGDEWEAEVLKNPKSVIMEMLRVVAKERDTERSQIATVTAEREAMREALQKIATTHRLDARLAGVAYGYQQIALAALKGGKG